MAPLDLINDIMLNKKLKEIIEEVQSWVVCSAITTPEDMAQNFERIAKITSPEYIEQMRKI